MRWLRSGEVQMLNCDIPPTEVWVRDEFLHAHERGHGDVTRGYAFGVASVPGQSIGFHVLLENGAQYGRLPLHALLVQPKGRVINNLEWIETWDCPSSTVSCVTYDFLAGKKVDARIPTQMANYSDWFPGEYLFTLDWNASAYADGVGDLGWKCAHVLRLDAGHFAALPNNKIRWYDKAFVRPFSERPDYKVNPVKWSVENV